MKIIERHILKEFIKIFFLCIMALISLYLLIDFFEKIDDLIEHNAALSEGFKFFMYKIPLILYQTSPIAVLLSTILSLGMLNKNIEITAIKASGISITRVISPLILASLTIGTFSFIINDNLVPSAKRESDIIKRLRIEGKKETLLLKQNKVWQEHEGNIYTISRIDSQKGIIYGITFYEIGRDFNIASRIDAREARWSMGKWRITDGIKREFYGNSIKTARIKDEMLPLKETPDNLDITERIADEMSFNELRNYISKLSQNGYDATRYIIDLHREIAFPFINIIMVVIGAPFALRTGRQSGIAMGIALSIAICFVYWIIFAVTTSLGYSGMMPPLLAAWSANFIFGIIGILMFMNIRD